MRALGVVLTGVTGQLLAWLCYVFLHTTVLTLAQRPVSCLTLLRRDPCVDYVCVCTTALEPRCLLPAVDCPHAGLQLCKPQGQLLSCSGGVVLLGYLP